jgi:predicted ATPase/DNA-binding CsgD family transcriptional regulator
MPNNLPQQLTSFIGRECEIAEVKRMLGGTRLLTLTGTGGSGKTRMALQVASGLLEDYPDGVWLVELAALTNPELIPQTVASAIGVREGSNSPSEHEPGDPIEVALTRFLRPLRALLVLDNCEHLVEGCARLVDALLRACPDLRILATSREALSTSGEAVWIVPSLSMPDLREELPVETMAQYEAIRLFTDRATFSRPSFRLTPENALWVARLCHRLDGLPLAIELAAARVKVLTVQQITVRLDERFRLLVSGNHTAMPRQQTLKALLDWSYDLLSESECALLRGLSVFAGGFPLEAVGPVCGGEVDEYEVIDLLSHLVDKSLVISEERSGEARYRLLETIRQYAWEKLRDSGEMLAMRGRHLEWHLSLAERAQTRILGEEQGMWLDRLETDHDNLRAALEWSIAEARAAEPTGGADPQAPHAGDSQDLVVSDAALRLAAALWRFWDIRGYLTEGRRWLQEALSSADGRQTTDDRRRGTEDGVSNVHRMGLRAKALTGAGNLALEQSDYERAMAYYNEALALRREIGDKRSIANSLNNLGVLARNKGDYDWATQLYEECLTIFRELDHKEGIASTLNNLGFVAQCQEDYDRAEQLYQESLALFEELASAADIAMLLNNLGEVAQCQGDYERAAGYYDQALALARELGDKPSIIGVLNNLASLANIDGEHERAAELYVESLLLCRELEYRQGIAGCLEGLAQAEAGQRPERAARLLGAAQALRKRINAPLSASERADHDRTVEMVRGALGEKAFAAEWARGQAVTLEEALALALERMPRVFAPGLVLANDLSRREMEVLRLVASGMTDAQVATQLALSIRTVNAHVHSIYEKLGVSGRNAATRFAVEHELV